MSSESPLILPVITVQATFPQVIQEVQEGIIPFEKFWISEYKQGEPSIHGQIHVELDETDRNKVNLTAAKGDLEIAELGDASGSHSCYSVTSKSRGVTTKIITPIQDYRDSERANPTQPHRIAAFALSPDSSRFATGFLDGSVLLYPSSAIPSDPPPSSTTESIFFPKDSKNKTVAKPHLSTVSSIQFFPSSRVLLSAGHDFTLTILPADLPDPSSPSSTPARVSPVRTLRAHTRPVTSTAILGVGRNVVSTSLDRTLKVWDVPSGEVTDKLDAQAGIVSSCLDIQTPAINRDGEAATQAMVLYAGLENGAFELFDLRAKKSVAYLRPSSTSSLTSLAYSHRNNLLATGSMSGVVALYDSRSLGSPLTSFTRLGGGVEGLSFISLSPGTPNGDTTNLGLAVGTSDGLPYIAGVIPEGPDVWAELVGVDCDAVRHVSAGEGDLWTASDDGVVRRYTV